MSATRITGYADSPAVWQPEWLPDANAFPELTELRTTYLRIYAWWGETSARKHTLADQLEMAKREQQQAMTDAVVAGRKPKAGDTAELEKELVEATEATDACTRALAEHVNTCVEVVCEHRDEWLGKLHAAEAGFALRRQELRAALVAKLAEKGKFWRLFHWVDRTSGQAAELPGMHLAYSEIPAPMSADPAEAERQFQEMAAESYGRGMTRISDEDGRAREAAAARPPDMAESEHDQVLEES